MQEELLLMNPKERARKAIMEGVKQGYFSVKKAAKRMDVTPRQARRILRHYEQSGDKGLIHKHRGNPSNNQLKSSIKQAVFSLYQSKYPGFGPTLAAEKLSLEGYELNAETLRNWLKKAGLWDKKCQRSPYRKRRQPSACFGELLQMDGSFHHWFGNHHPTASLMNLVDDATGTTLSFMDKEETTEAAMIVLMQWIERYGVPKAFYVDLKTVYVSPKTYRNNEEHNEAIQAFTHFSRGCNKLGIEIIKAYSPQAKGRVERKHAIFQDRFVKELVLQGITTIARANTLLEKGFVDNLNCKFAKTPRSLDNAHHPSPKKHELNQVFCWEYQRKVQNDWVVQFHKKYYQLDRSVRYVKPKQTVTVRQHLAGTISLWQREKTLNFTEIKHRVKSVPRPKKGYDTWAMSERARQNKHKSPWNQFNPSWLAPKKQAVDFMQNNL
jgi:transposase